MLGSLALLGFIWTLIVNGYAVAIANNISLGRGIIVYFVIGLLVFLFFFLLFLPLSLIVSAT